MKSGALSRRGFMQITGLGVAAMAMLEAAGPLNRIASVVSPNLDWSSLAWSGWYPSMASRDWNLLAFWQARYRAGVRSKWEIQFFCVSAVVQSEDGKLPGLPERERAVRDAIEAANKTMRDYVKPGQFKVHDVDGNESWRSIGCVEWLLGDRLLHPKMGDPLGERGAPGAKLQDANPDTAALLKKPTKNLIGYAPELVGTGSPMLNVMRKKRVLPTPPEREL